MSESTWHALVNVTF